MDRTARNSSSCRQHAVKARSRQAGRAYDKTGARQTRAKAHLQPTSAGWLAAEPAAGEALCCTADFSAPPIEGTTPFRHHLMFSVGSCSCLATPMSLPRPWRNHHHHHHHHLFMPAGRAPLAGLSLGQAAGDSRTRHHHGRRSPSAALQQQEAAAAAMRPQQQVPPGQQQQQQPGRLLAHSARRHTAARRTPRTAREWRALGGAALCCHGGGGERRF